MVTVEEICTGREGVVADDLGEGLGEAVVAALGVSRVAGERRESGGRRILAVSPARQDVEVLDVALIGRIGYVDELRQADRLARRVEDGRRPGCCWD